MLHFKVHCLANGTPFGFVLLRYCVFIAVVVVQLRTLLRYGTISWLSYVLRYTHGNGTALRGGMLRDTPLRYSLLMVPYIGFRVTVHS